MASMPPPVSVLLLGSGWTSKFLLPALRECKITCAYTKRKIAEDEPGAIPFIYPANSGKESVAAYRRLPKAEMVVLIFPLTSNEMIESIIESYESASQCTPAWLALGSTGAWSKGIINSSTPISGTSARAKSEEHLLSLDSERRKVAVLNLSGLYGGGRNPVNFAKKVGETKEKLEGKTSLHLVHGKDVAQAIIGLYESLAEEDMRKRMWGKRWIVTDTHVYDWWQLFTTLRPSTHADAQRWVKDLCEKYEIQRLPRTIMTAGQDGKKNTAPYVLDRAVDGESFWRALGKRPIVGRCDDYTTGGGGKELVDEEERQAKEAL